MCASVDQKFFNIRRRQVILKHRITTYRRRALLDYKNSAVRTTLRRAISLSKEKTNFSFGKYGFIFLTESLTLRGATSSVLFAIKKLLYSFGNRNEMHRYVLRRYARAKLLSSRKVRKGVDLVSRSCDNLSAYAKPGAASTDRAVAPGLSHAASLN